MDKEKISVTMTLKDYEELTEQLKTYKKLWDSTRTAIKKASTINENGDIIDFNFKDIKNYLEEIYYDI